MDETEASGDTTGLQDIHRIIRKPEPVRPSLSMRSRPSESIFRPRTGPLVPEKPMNTRISNTKDERRTELSSPLNFTPSTTSGPQGPSSSSAPSPYPSVMASPYPVYYHHSPYPQYHVFPVPHANSPLPRPGPGQSIPPPYASPQPWSYEIPAHSSPVPLSFSGIASPAPQYHQLPSRHPMEMDPRMQAFINIVKNQSPLATHTNASPFPMPSFHSSATPSPVALNSFSSPRDSPVSQSSDGSKNRKRKRSAARETLQYCGLFKDSNFTQDFKIHSSHDDSCVSRIRLWMDNEKKIYFDCICDKRKPTQDLRKILRHSAGHDVSQYTCPDCGRVFQHHLGLNSHQRIHKK